jgi:aspartate 1-decarboxylase
MLLRLFVRAVIEGLVVAGHEAGPPSGLALPAELMDAADLDTLEEVRLEPEDAGTPALVTVLLTPTDDTVVAHGALARQLPVGSRLSVAASCQLDREEIAHHRARLVRVSQSRVVEIVDLTPTDLLDE